MGYIIYNNVSEEAFENLHQRIANMKPAFGNFLMNYDFEPTDNSQFADILGLDFVYKGSRYHGNIGFLFDDGDSKLYTFTFYITKSFDENGIRYFKRDDLSTGVKLDYIEQHYFTLLEQAIKAYQHLNDSDLIITRKLK